jgi:rhodanese/phosphatase family RapZ-like protein
VNYAKPSIVISQILADLGLAREKDFGTRLIPRVKGDPRVDVVVLNRAADETIALNADLIEVLSRGQGCRFRVSVYYTDEGGVWTHTSTDGQSFRQAPPQEQTAVVDEPEDTVHSEVVSFGYRHAPAPEAHVVLNLGCHFRDPHISPEMRELTARDDLVRETVLNTPGIRDLIQATTDLATSFLSGGPVVIAIGCAGGRHLSPVVADSVAKRLERIWDLSVDVTHRDLSKPVIDY